MKGGLQICGPITPKCYTTDIITKNDHIITIVKETEIEENIEKVETSPNNKNNYFFNFLTIILVVCIEITLQYFIEFIISLL